MPKRTQRAPREGEQAAWERAESLEAFVAASQEAQARGLQTGIEANRLRADGVGTFIWQWNEPWPAVCWSVLPYWGPPKRAYAQIARSYAALAPLARILPGAIELWVVNDRLDAPGLCQFIALCDGATVWEGAVLPPVNGRTQAAVLPRPTGTRLELRLICPDGTRFTNAYVLAPAPAPTRSLYRWAAEWVKRFLLRW